MKLAGETITNEQAYDLLSLDESLVSRFEVTAEERKSFWIYAEIRAHHDYLKTLQIIRGEVV